MFTTEAMDRESKVFLDLGDVQVIARLSLKMAAHDRRKSALRSGMVGLVKLVVVK